MNNKVLASVIDDQDFCDDEHAEKDPS
ncbi:hypothetical protein NPIL_35051, partial [Nephila pilipes]